MAYSARSFSAELRIIRAARNKGRKAGVHPGLYNSPVTLQREQFLLEALGLAPLSPEGNPHG